MAPLNKSCQTSLLKSILCGAVGFTIVSLGGFSVWAFAGSWFYRNVGEAGLYVVSAVVFVLLAGLLLHPLLLGENRIIRFYKAFVPAFFAYSFVWSVCWFVFKFGKGEWLGSFLGCATFAWVLGRLIGSTNGFFQVLAVLFVGHSAGYFLGGLMYMSKSHPDFLGGLSKRQIALLGRMLWGLLYGFGFGAGIGFAFYRFQMGGKVEPANQSQSDLNI